MSGIRDRNTAPELVVRRLAHAMGYRFRLHRRDLPGKPDMVFPRLKKAIFVHGCFWHQHNDPKCKIARTPATNRAYWVPKLERNSRRDSEATSALQRLGWQTLAVWECETRASPLGPLTKKLRSFLGN